jgi:uncharacterized low-complexity protein
MTTHRLINISIALAGALLFATVLSASQLLGPDDIETERQQMRDLQESKRQAQQQARFDKAAQAVCGENAGYALLSDGAIQCFTHRGYRTSKAYL